MGSEEKSVPLFLRGVGGTRSRSSKVTMSVWCLLFVVREEPDWWLLVVQQTIDIVRNDQQVIFPRQLNDLPAAIYDKRKQNPLSLNMVLLLFKEVL